MMIGLTTTAKFPTNGLVDDSCARSENRMAGSAFGIFVIVSLHFMSGLILFNLGIVGRLYLGRIFIEMKPRPIYVVEQAIGI